MIKFTEWYEEKLEEMAKKAQPLIAPKEDGKMVISAKDLKSGSGHQPPAFKTGAHKQKKDGKGNRSSKDNKAIKDASY